MEDIEKDKNICKEVCACIQSALIAGYDECLYGGEGHLDFWDYELTEDSEFIDIVSPEEFEAEFWVNGKYVKGTWREIIHTITPSEVIFVRELSKYLGITCLTNGFHRIVIEDKEVIFHTTCCLNTFLEVQTGIRLSEELYRKFVHKREDGYPTECILIFDECYCCGCKVESDDMYWSEDEQEYYCEDCYWECHDKCSICGRDTSENYIEYKDGDYFCPNCYERHVKKKEENI